jgi:hypothetical protein
MKNVSEIDSDDNLSIDLCADPIVDEVIAYHICHLDELQLLTFEAAWWHFALS